MPRLGYELAGRSSISNSTRYPTSIVARPTGRIEGRPGSGWNRELAGQREVLAQHPRMACRDAKQGERWPLWHATPLLPVAERMDADIERDREGPLRESGQAPEGGHVRPTPEF